MTRNYIKQDGSKTMCKGVPSSACDKLLKPEKVHRGRLKRIVKDYVRLPTMKRSILERLHDFIGQFLSGGYNGTEKHFIFHVYALSIYKSKLCTDWLTHQC